jgi:hypothetical protein
MPTDYAVSTVTEGSLTAAVLDYQDSGKNLKCLLDRISLDVYEYPSRWTDWDDDARSEFFLEFLPKLPGLVTRFRYTGRPFEVYLRSCLRWFLRTYAAGRTARENRKRFAAREMGIYAEEVAESLRPDAFVDSSENDSTPAKQKGPFLLDGDGSIANPVFRRRFLFLALLGGANLNGDTLIRAAQLAGREVEWFSKRIEEVNRLVAHRIARRETLRERRNECWYRMTAAEYHAGDEPVPEKKAMYASRARTWKVRFNAARRDLGRLAVLPTHEDVARILGVPKGTVDSGLHYLRKFLRDRETS